MDGRNPTLAGVHAAAGRSAKGGVAFAPFLIIPFIVQADICAARMELTRQSPLGMGFGLLAVLSLLAIVLRRQEVARVFRDAQPVFLGFYLLATIAIAGALLPDACFDEGGKYISYPSVFAILFTLSLASSALFVGDSSWRLAVAVALAILVASIYSTYRLGRRRQNPACMAMAGFVFLQGFFSHNLMDDKAVLFMWALLLLGRATLSQPVVVRATMPVSRSVRTRTTVAPRLAEVA